jgi:hypothetical protein
MHWKIVEWINENNFIVWDQKFKSPKSAQNKINELIASNKNKLQVVAYVEGKYSDIPLDKPIYPK